MNAFSSQLKNLCWAMALLDALFLSSAVSAATIHVDIAAQNGGDGQAATPYNNLQTAIDNAANSGDVIFIAQGTYKPTTGNDRSVSFVISGKNVSLRGKNRDSYYLSVLKTKTSAAAFRSASAASSTSPKDVIEPS